MYPDEDEIRRDLSLRALRPGAEAWSDVARRLSAPAPAPRARMLVMAAALLLLLTVSVRQWQGRTSAPSVPDRGFMVSRAESRGRPASPIVVQPDRDTVIVVVPD